jgi:1-acyl-sn-glycerol-3-phosphate acyltransferase
MLARLTASTDRRLRAAADRRAGPVAARAPMAAPTLYFANHTSHGDFVLLWAALPATCGR